MNFMSHILKKIALKIYYLEFLHYKLVVFIDVSLGTTWRWIECYKKKSTVMVLAGRQKRKKQRWWIGARDKDVGETEGYKYLGVWMDSKLRGNTQLEKRIRKAEDKQRVGWMGRVNGTMELSEGLSYGKPWACQQ